MTRYKQTSRIIGLTGVATAIVVGLSAVPVGATLICSGTVNPVPPPVNKRYCENVPPIGNSSGASLVKGTRATLNGTSGPGVPGGDITTFVFLYGRTTMYGRTTDPGTVGPIRASRAVSRNIHDLVPCTTYHDRIVSTNPDGTTAGGDSKFTTKFASPLTNVVAPQTIRHHRFFKVKFTVVHRARVNIYLKLKGTTVKHIRLGYKSDGVYKKRIRAPRTIGAYELVVAGRLGCGVQQVQDILTVS